MSNESQVAKALIFAEKHHGNQRYGDHPYIVHLTLVLGVGIELGFPDSVLAGCVLHDTLEDTPVSYNDIKKVFGAQVADIVYTCTDELGKNRTERKLKIYEKLRLNELALCTKLCDRIANVRFSKMTGSKMWHMYQEEHEKFAEKLYDGNQAGLEHAWRTLEREFI